MKGWTDCSGRNQGKFDVESMRLIARIVIVLMLVWKIFDLESTIGRRKSVYW